MIVAGLDVASATGVCIGTPGAAPRFFTRDLGAGRPHDERFAEALRLAKHLISDCGVEAIGIEAPIIVANRDKKSTNELLMGLIACIRGWAAIKGIPCQTFETRTIDKHCLGYVPKGRDARKAAAMRWCTMQGWNPTTQDECDAALCREIMSAHMSPAYAAASGTLLSRRDS